MIGPAAPLIALITAIISTMYITWLLFMDLIELNRIRNDCIIESESQMNLTQIEKDQRINECINSKRNKSCMRWKQIPLISFVVSSTLVSAIMYL